MAQLSYELTFEAASGDIVAFTREGFSVHSDDGVTVLGRAMADQADLHDVIERIYRLGLELIEIRQVSGATSPR
jgi:hypothetical protein